MQELSCTVRGNHYKLPSPFFVLATQNPIELEGTYPLPEAQLDRFLFNIVLDYLSAEDEVKVVDLTTTTRAAQVQAGHQREEILDFQQLVRMVPIAESLAAYVVKLVRATRHNSGDRSGFREEVRELRRQRSRRAIYRARRQRRARWRGAAITSHTKTSPRWRSPCCATASCSIFMPNRIASIRTKFCGACSKHCRLPQGA